MFCTYILQSKKDQSFYIGHTTKLKQRLRLHAQGSSLYSKNKTPFVLVWCAFFKNKNLAIKFERYLKSSSGFAFRNKHLV